VVVGIWRGRIGLAKKRPAGWRASLLLKCGCDYEVC
jgi:hypothetical protein